MSFSRESTGDDKSSSRYVNLLYISCIFSCFVSDVILYFVGMVDKHLDLPEDNLFKFELYMPDDVIVIL